MSRELNGLSPLSNGTVPAPTLIEGCGLVACAPEAAAFLKALSHEGRLAILCHLTEGERSVTELERLLGSRQAAVSQQLARLRLEGLVSTRREGKTIFYAIQDPKVLQTIQLLNGMYIQAA